MEDLDSRADEGSEPETLELVKAARSIANLPGVASFTKQILNQSADRIEALEKENARLMEGLAPAGYVVVPKEPTERMMEAAWPIDMSSFERAREIYRAMIAASQEDAE